MKASDDDVFTTRRLRGQAVATGLLSLLVGAVGLLWLGRPSTYPFGSGDKVTVSVTHLIEHGLAGALLLSAGALGLVASAFAARQRGRGTGSLIAVTVTACETLFFGLVMADVTLMVGLAYGLALTSPLIVVAIVAVACVRRRRSGYVAAAVLLGLGVIGVGTGFLTVGSLSRFAVNVGRGFANYDSRLLWGIGMSAIAAGWAILTYRLLQQSAMFSGQRPAWTTPGEARRWGRVVAIAAALCPLPYGLIRLTWLTPWPVGLMDSEDTPAVRMQGAGLGIAAVGGTLLTVGLIARWGQQFPQWMPVVHGRLVPPKVAVIPGGVVAAAACVAAPGFVLHGIETDGMGVGLLPALLLFPFPIWGPLLGSAVLAYWLRRGPSQPTGRFDERPRRSARTPPWTDPRGDVA